MDCEAEILRAMGDEKRFIRLVLSGPKDSAGADWLKVAVRPVEMARPEGQARHTEGGQARGRSLQAALQGRRKQVTQNIAPAELPAELHRILGMGFLNVHLQCTDGDLHVRITRKGKTLVSRGKPSVRPATQTAGKPATRPAGKPAGKPAAGRSLETAPPAEPHDRRKSYPFPPDEPDAFLEAVGIMRRGRVLPTMRDKFRQVNHFLSLLGHTQLVRQPPSAPVRLVDCGCGKAFLTLAAYHYLREMRGLAVELTGIDADPEVVARAKELRDKLGYKDVRLVQSGILEYDPSERPQAVLSLHACDTATDEAIAQGVKWEADLILCAPCCQHELHHQLTRPEFRAALRHGILRERVSDILTDALRAAALRVMGYRTDVIEFVSPEHTAKNVMIRAEKARGIGARDAVDEYLALRDFWAVKPQIEKLLGTALQERLARPAAERRVP